MPLTHNSPLVIKQYVSTRLAFPSRMLLISVPVSTMPAVKVSMKKYSNEAFLFLMFTGLFFLISSSSLFTLVIYNLTIYHLQLIE